MALINKDKLEKEHLPPHCEIPGCNYDYFVTRHRIRRGKNGGKYVPGNVIVLCPNHHVEAESGKITKFRLFEIVHARLREKSRASRNGRYTKAQRINIVY